MAHFKIESPAVMAAPNVIPMADIMLVLLIIFMVVTPLLQKDISVDMAKVAHPADLPDADRADSIVIGITRSGDIFLGNQKSDVTQLTSQVRDRLAGHPDHTVFIKSDGRAKYGDVVKVVDEVRAAGVDNIGLLTERIEPNKGAAAK